MHYSLFFQEILGLYSMAFLGFWARKKGILKENAIDVFTQLILTITLPALILFSLNTTFSLSLIKDFLWLISMSVYILAASILFVLWLSRTSKLPKNQRSVYVGLTIFGNQGFIGYAISYILLGEQGIVNLTMFNLLYLVLIWTFGIYIFSKSKTSMDWKLIYFNPGIISTGIGLILFFLPIQLPSFIHNGLEVVGKMTIPLSMMLIGILLGNVEFRKVARMLKNSYLWSSALIRLLVIPLLLLPFAIFDLSFNLLLLAVMVSGTPSAPTIILYAQQFGVDSSFATLGVLLSTLLCIVTIPILYIVLHLL